MDKVSILHAFPNGSTFLADVSSSILRRPVVSLTTHDGPHAIASDVSHEAFMSALSALMPASQSWVHDAGGEDELSVIRVVSITGSVDFHKRLIAECESYCRLCWRLQHAVDWVLLREPVHKNNTTSKLAPSHASDVDLLSHLVYPLEPTAFLAAAFALPPLVAVASSLPEDEDPAASGRQNGLRSSESSQTVPYCFFYRCPVLRLLQGDAVGSYSRSGCGGEECPSETPRMTLMERIASVASVAGVCGCVSPLHSTLSVRNRTKIGLTLSAYIEGCLPLSVTTNGDGASVAVTREGEDPFSRWRDDILWRLLGLLVSALAVAHASGFHFCGELSADDILCFALPEGDTNGFAQETLSHEGKQDPKSMGQRLREWVKGNQGSWLITDATPAHHAFFMFATLPRCLFMEKAKTPSDVAAAQRRDTAAVGRILVAVVEEMKRRRGANGVNSCSELLFVAERMAAVEGGGGRMLEAEAPAHRFSQLQAVQLRTYLWLLRAIVEERDTQLAAALLHNNSAVKSKESKLPSAASPLTEDNMAFLEQLKERDRLLSEREKKLDRFLHLYELTAERLDELPVRRDSFDHLRRSLLCTPCSRPTATPRTPPNTASASAPIPPARVRQPNTTSTRRPATAAATEATPSDRTGPLYGLLRSSREDKAGAAPAPASNTAPSSRSMAAELGSERRTQDVTPRQRVLRVSPEAVSASSSSLLHLNWNAAGNTWIREGVTATAATAKSSRTYHPRSVLPGDVGRPLTARTQTSFAFATAVAAAATAGKGGGVSTVEGKAPAKLVPARRAVLPTAAASSGAHVRCMTPTRGHGQASILLSPGVSPLAHVTDDSSSLLLATGYKTPPPTKSISASPQSRGATAVNVWNRLSISHSASSTTPGATPRHMEENSSSRYAKHLKLGSASDLGLSPVSGHLSGATPKDKTPRYKPSLYVSPPKGATDLFATPPSSTMKRSKTLALSARSPLRKCDTSVQVIRMRDDSGDSCLNTPRGAPLTRHRGYGVSGSIGAKTKTPNAGSLDGTQRLRSNEDLLISKLLNDSNPVAMRQSGTPQRSTPGRPQSRQRQGQEENATPRVSRQRLANDGWVDHKLEALEQLRYDFQQSEQVKSARSPPRGKSFTRSPKEPNAACDWGASTLQADRGRNADASAWGDIIGQPAAHATGNDSKSMC
ncbi:hypothetical protein TraAM80_06460 [Trypanosoma rangeli]|uniref:Uncharacterized protein n=1 Tax=Trypanosoma rangeli TaxID=5698 RepID=A0A3R7LS71_TRYRA|nr:uncharacterized protein TraAM80_06460 [Trypanosoma rangeli]RNF02324.1 hypothetical protein TraAM80_06460 [Trypanosoma rangeli]|eukprot:RNF02324.1 hypothetical protein TraAM80_06460 [Trypanosoma rangeli]